MNKIKTFEDACKALNLDAKALPDVSLIPEKHRKAMLALFMLVIIAEAINEGWTPNWNDDDELKYYAWFEVEATEECPAGSGFSNADYDCTDTFTNVGSRLVYRTRELALYAGKQFAELYKDYLLLT